MGDRSDREIFKRGRIFGMYMIKRLVGQGGYGDIYSAVRKDQEVGTRIALKVEELTARKQALEKEYGFMSRLGDSPYFPKLIDYGVTKKYRFLAMELLGPSLTSIRMELRDQHFSLSTSIRLAIEMLRAIRDLHKRGIVHRDIKPSQVLVRASMSHPIALIDFGLSRYYVVPETGEMLEPRKNPGFVGTGKYASFNAHKGKELGRRDDLYSWFYSVYELKVGKVPWAVGKDRAETFKNKQKIDITKYITKHLPKQFMDIWKLIEKLDFYDEPDYDLITAFLVEAFEEAGCSWKDPYEWLNMSAKMRHSLCVSIPLQPGAESEPIVPTGLPPAVLPSSLVSAQSQTNEEEEEVDPPDENEGGCTAHCSVQ